MHRQIAKIALLLPLACGGDRALEARLRADAEEAAQARREARLQVKRERSEKMAAADARNAARAKAYAAQRAELDSLTVVPPASDLPKTLDAACDGLVSAHDAFVASTLEGDALAQWTGGGNVGPLGDLRRECMTTSIAAAACETHALTMAGPELEPRLSEIRGACERKSRPRTTGNGAI